MEKVVTLDQKMNLATLCLRLYEEMEKHYAGSSYLIKPMPRDEVFGKEVAIGEDTYRELFAAICGLIDYFHNEDDEIIISTYHNGITITGLEVASEDLDNLCYIKNDKFLIQKSTLGIALAFLNQEQVKIERSCGEKRDGIGFAFPKESEKLYAGTASK